MYDHDIRVYKCKKCSFSCHFPSELKTHKITHWTEPLHQCMVKGCGHWFKRKWELTSHLQKHDGKEYNCDECTLSTNLDKQLKEHKKSHSKDLPYGCDHCEKQFRYRSSLKSHKDKLLRDSKKK